MDSLVKIISKYDFMYLSQEFDNNVLVLVEQKLFYPYEYISDFEKWFLKINFKVDINQAICCTKVLTVIQSQ